MADKYKVMVKVVSQQGFCAFSHSVGDQWIFDGQTPPNGMCLGALQSLMPAIMHMMYGGSFYWESDPNTLHNMMCPDAANPVVFEIQRIVEGD